MSVSERVKKIFKSNIVIDGLMLAGLLNVDLIKKLRFYNYTAGSFTVGEHNKDTLRAMVSMEQVRWIVNHVHDEALIVEYTEDIEKAHEEGKFAVIMNFQGAEPLGEEFHLLSIFCRLGLRIIQPILNQRNAWGDGCLEPENRGLTHIGRQFVRDCNRVGIVVDLSHAGERMCLETIDFSAKPCIISHANPMKLHKNPRNITDEEMKLCAERGGVVGLCPFSAFVGDTTDGKNTTRAELIKHIVYTIYY